MGHEAEAACTSVHGANRLGANSLLDIVVFGKACAKNIYKIHNDKPIEDCDENELHRDLEKYHHYKHKTGDVNVSDLRLEMQNTMQKHAVFRNDKLLSEGVGKMQNVYEQFADVSIDDKSDTFNSEFIELLEVKKSTRQLSRDNAQRQLKRKSRCSFTRKLPKKRDDDNWLCHTIAKLTHTSEVTKTNVSLSKRKVIFLH